MELNLELSPSMRVIQTSILDLMENCLRDIRHSNPTVSYLNYIGKGVYILYLSACCGVLSFSWVSFLIVGSIMKMKLILTVDFNNAIFFISVGRRSINCGV